MDNPFRYGEVASGEFFTNRVEELAELEQDLRSGQNVMMMSPRRYGKTSLIQQVIARLRADGVLVVYLDLFGIPTKEIFVREFAKALHLGLFGPARQMMQSVLDAFKGLSIVPRFSLDDAGKPVLELAPAARSGDVDRDIDVLLALPERIAQDRKKRVVLVFDEFQQIVELDPRLVPRMRSIFQNQPGVAHVYLGSRFHLMNNLFNNINEPMYKSAKSVPLLPFKSSDFASFIRARFTETQKTISDEAIDRILEITGCHPNDTQQLCYFTWALAHATGRPPTPELVDQALDRIVSAEDARYTLLWESLSARQRTLLLALANATGQIFSERFRKEHQLGSAATVQTAANRLKEREIIEPRTGGGYAIPDVFLKAWIRRTLLASREPGQ